MAERNSTYKSKTLWAALNENLLLYSHQSPINVRRQINREREFGVVELLIEFLERLWGLDGKELFLSAYTVRNMINVSFTHAGKLPVFRCCRLLMADTKWSTAADISEL